MTWPERPWPRPQGAPDPKGGPPPAPPCFRRGTASSPPASIPPCPPEKRPFFFWACSMPPNPIWTGISRWPILAGGCCRDKPGCPGIARTKNLLVAKLSLGTSNEQRAWERVKYPATAGGSNLSGAAETDAHPAAFHQHRHMAVSLGEAQHLRHGLVILDDIPIVDGETLSPFGLPGLGGEGSCLFAENSDLLGHGPPPYGEST